MKAILIAILSVGLMGMGGKRPVPPPDNGPTPIPSPAPGSPGSPTDYQTQFKTIGASYGANFVAQSVAFSFRNFSGSTVGMCTFYSSGARNSVALSIRAWDSGSNTFREMLTFHELGHCLLGRAHLNTRYSDGRPESLMNSWLFDQRSYLANRDQYLKELFQAADHNFAAQSASRQIDYDDCEFGKGQDSRPRKRLR